MRDDSPYLANPDGTKLYDHTPLADRDWGVRRDRIVAQIAALMPDIICLQEVEFKVFDTELGPALKELGYDGVIQDDPKRAEKQSTGNATFHRADTLTVQWQQHRSRSLLTEYSPVVAPTDRFLVANVHLQGDPTRGDLRLAQFKSVTKAATKRRGAAAGLRFGAVVIGDFNEDVAEGSSEVGKLMAASSPRFVSARVAAGIVDPTFVLPGRTFEIDFAVVVEGEARVHAVADFLSDGNDRTEVLRHGIPNATFASDHLPIAVNLSTGRLVPLQPAGAAGVDVAPMTVDQLWQACPLSHDDRATFERLLEEEMAARPRGKPSQDQLATLATIRKRKERFEGGLSDDSVAFCGRMRKALKKGGGKVKK